MKRALAVLAASLPLFGCGESASQPPPQSADDAAAAPETPAADAAPAAEEEEGAWSGEAEARAEAPPETGGKAETRTMEVIAQLVKENRQPVRDCMDQAKKELPDLKGDLVVSFVIDPEGNVKKAELNQERSTLKAPKVVECAVKTIKGIKFPPSSRGMDTTVNYPYNLN